tara:strand:+ start:4115 stop:4990 length:876 start_codon:yes stop_codon:yes gene_type:complete
MKMILEHASSAELLWVQRKMVAQDQECWHFTSATQDISIWLEPLTMADVCPFGQLLIAELDVHKGVFAINHIVVIKEIEDAAVIIRHFAWVPAGKESLLRDIWGMLNYLPSPALRTFYKSVLADDELMQPFLTSMASHHHHHDYAGGLIEHSHEVAMTAAALSLLYGLEPLSVSVAFIGGLLHDIGKIHLYYNVQGPHGVLGQHESFNFMVLAKQLTVLRLSAPKLFEALSCCLSIKFRHQNDAYLPSTIVHMCDRLSVDVCNWRRAFANVPHYYWYAKSPRDALMYKRLG